MKLKFKLLIIDDEEQSAQAAISILETHLIDNGFTLEHNTISDVTESSIKRCAKREGKDYDLVIIDFGLGNNIDGSDAAAMFRSQLPFTDIIFFSSSPHVNLLQKLAEKEVAGVFVSLRKELGDTLVGVANTIIGKAIDLNHMRGIAIAEVAEIDQSLEEILVHLFSADPLPFKEMDKEFLQNASASTQRLGGKIAPLIENRSIIEIISDSTIFSSFQKYQTIRALAKNVPDCRIHLDSLAPYQNDIIEKRNILAHAMERTDDNGRTTLKTLRKNSEEITIDDEWMKDFRRKLSLHRQSISSVCDIMRAHVESTKRTDAA